MSSVELPYSHMAHPELGKRHADTKRLFISSQDPEVHHTLYCMHRLPIRQSLTTSQGLKTKSESMDRCNRIMSPKQHVLPGPYVPAPLPELPKNCFDSGTSPRMWQSVEKNRSDILKKYYAEEAKRKSEHDVKVSRYLAQPVVDRTSILEKKRTASSATPLESRGSLKGPPGGWPGKIDSAASPAMLALVPLAPKPIVYPPEAVPISDTFDYADIERPAWQFVLPDYLKASSEEVAGVNYVIRFLDQRVGFRKGLRPLEVEVEEAKWRVLQRERVVRDFVYEHRSSLHPEPETKSIISKTFSTLKAMAQAGVTETLRKEAEEAKEAEAVVVPENHPNWVMCRDKLNETAYAEEVDQFALRRKRPSPEEEQEFRHKRREDPPWVIKLVNRDEKLQELCVQERDAQQTLQAFQNGFDDYLHRVAKIWAPFIERNKAHAAARRAFRSAVRLNSSILDRYVTYPDSTPLWERIILKPFSRKKRAVELPPIQ